MLALVCFGDGGILRKWLVVWVWFFFSFLLFGFASMGNCWYRWEPTVNRVSANAKSGKNSDGTMDFDAVSVFMMIQMMKLCFLLLLFAFEIIYGFLFCVFMPVAELLFVLFSSG